MLHIAKIAAKTHDNEPAVYKKLAAFVDKSQSRHPNQLPEVTAD